MAERFTQKLSKHFDEEIRFFKTWIDKPKDIGSVLPTSGATARKMASLLDRTNSAPVLELGPGTGVITKAILAAGIDPEKVYSVEYTEGFIEKLRFDFPGVNILHGDAFNLDDVLPDMQGKKFQGIVSALPLLNFRVDDRIALIDNLLDRLQPGHAMVQISYGPKSPVPPNWSNYTVEPLDWMARNIPPARLWVYRRVQMM